MYHKTYTLIIRKLLASSSFAIAGTFDTLIRRLQAIIAHQNHEDAGLVVEMETELPVFTWLKE
jgi:hypothetical protein